MRRQRVPVGDEMERLVFGRAIGQACVLHLQPIRQRAEVMADVEASCGPHPAQYPFLFSAILVSSPVESSWVTLSNATNSRVLSESSRSRVSLARFYLRG